MKKTVKPKLWTGKRFAELQNTVASNYEKKGMSPKKAEVIGAAVAAKQWMKKYWKTKMVKMAQKGKLK